MTDLNKPIIQQIGNQTMLVENNHRRLVKAVKYPLPKLMITRPASDLTHIERKILTKNRGNELVLLSLRDNYLLHKGDAAGHRKLIYEEFVDELLSLQNSGLTIHVHKNENMIAIYVIEIGPLVDINSDYADLIDYRSPIDLLSPLQPNRLKLVGNELHVTMDDSDMIHLANNEISYILEKLLPDVNLSVTHAFEKSNYPVLFFTHDGSYHMKMNQSIALLSDEPGAYLNRVIDNQRVLILGGPCPTGYTHLAPDNIRIDFLDRLEDDFILPFLQLIGSLYHQKRFVEYFKEFWTSFRGGIDDDLAPLLTFKYLYNQLMGVTDGSFSLPDDQLHVIRVVLQGFKHNQVLDRGSLITLPKRIWLRGDDLRSDLALFALLPAIYNSEGDPIDLVVFGSSNISNFTLQDKIWYNLSMLLQDQVKFFVTDDPELDMLRIITDFSPKTIQYLSRYYTKPNRFQYMAITEQGELMTIELPDQRAPAKKEIFDAKQPEIEPFHPPSDEIEIRPEPMEDEIEWPSSPYDREIPIDPEDSDAYYKQMLVDMEVSSYVTVLNSDGNKLRSEEIFSRIHNFTPQLGLLKQINDNYDKTLEYKTTDKDLVHDLKSTGYLDEIEAGDVKLLTLTTSGIELINKLLSSLDYLKIEDDKKALREREILNHIEMVHELAKKLGRATHIKFLIQWVRTLCHYEYSKSGKYNHKLMTILMYWHDQPLYDPDHFIRIFLAQYLDLIYTHQNDVLEEVDSNASRETEISEEKLRNIPRIREDVDEISDDVPFEEALEVVERGEKIKRYKPTPDVEPTPELDLYFVDTPIPSIKSVELVGGGILLGEMEDVKRIDRFYPAPVYYLAIPQRCINLLEEMKISTIEELVKYNDAFVSKAGIGDKLNQILHEIRDKFRRLETLDLAILAESLNNTGLKYLLLQGGKIPIEQMPDDVYRYLNIEEKQEFAERLNQENIPEQIVREFISLICGLMGLEDVNDGDLDEVLMKFNQLELRIFYSDEFREANLLWIIHHQEEYEKGGKDYTRWRESTFSNIKTLIEQILIPINQVNN